MAFKKIDVKKLMNFDFGYYSQSKDIAFSRLTRDDTFTETRIVLQDYDIMKREEDDKSTEDKLEIISSGLDIEQLKELKVNDVEKRTKDVEKALKSYEKKIKQAKPKEKLLTEFYIVI
jgi:hypothetical protein